MSFTPSGGESVEIAINAEDNASGAFSSVEGSALNMKNAVGAAGGILAGAGVAAFGKAADAAINFEDAMAGVEKVTSEAVAKELESDIKDLATEIPLAHDELAELATQAGRMGAEGVDEITEFTEVAAQMGAATTLSADDAGTALGKVSSALDEPLENVGALGDAINETSNNFQATSDEIVDSTQRSGQALSTLGLESDEIIGLSGAFNEVSSSSRVAAQRMQQVSESMMDPDNVEMFADMLGVSAEEFEHMRDEAPQDTMMELMDSIGGNQDALDTLNDELTTAQSRAFRDTAESADTMRDAMDTSNQAMEEGGSLAKEVGVETDTMAGQMELLKNELHNVMITMGDAFLPVLIDIVEVVGPMVSAFADLNERLDGAPAVIMAATAAVGGLTIALTALTGIAATTILPIIAALALLGATAYAIYTAWDNNMGGIQEAAQAMWDAVEPALASVQLFAEKVFEDYVMPLLVELQELWEEQFSLIMDDVVETMDVVSEKIETVLEFLGKFWGEHGDTIMTIVGATFAYLELTIGTAMRAISATIRIVLALIRGDFDEVLDIVEEFWTTTFGDILGFVEGPFMDGIKAVFGLLFDVVSSAFEKLYNFLIGNSIVPDTFNEILDFLENWMASASESVSEFLSKLAGLWTNKLADITQTVRSAITRVTTWLMGAGVSKFRGAFEAIAGGVMGVIRDLKSNIMGVISDTVSGITNGISDAIDIAINAFNSRVPDSIDFPSASIGGQSLNIPSATVNNPLGSDWSVGGGSLSIPSTTVGGGGFELPQLAEGGIITDDTLARIGEAGDSEAVLPLDKLSHHLDTAYEVGADTVATGGASRGSSSSSGSQFAATLRVEGDNDLAELIRENAELVVEEKEQSKSNRISRM